ncbi:MAG: hypothetical protein F6K44_23620, partial [Moorea sp. SIO3E2]|nr:hypothetical protein [Moorena sp. SIO3E2]
HYEDKEAEVKATFWNCPCVWQVPQSPQQLRLGQHRSKCQCAEHKSEQSFASPPVYYHWLD